MLEIKWNNKVMDIGIKIIDEQHMNLITLINRIMISIEEENQIENIEAFINDAINYSEYHFNTEEEFFEKIEINKKDIEEHKKEHQEFIRVVTTFNKDLKTNITIKNNNGIEMATALYRYLANWIVHHIIEKDKTLLIK
jgi:hemerythrin